MKRITIVICSFCAIVAICSRAEYTIEQTTLNMESAVNEILLASESVDAEKPNKEAILIKVDSLNEYWISVERTMSNYVHKNLVESMSQSIARLYPLAEYEDWPSFYSELMSIGWQIDNINASDSITLANII